MKAVVPANQSCASVGFRSVSVGRWLELAAYDREVWQVARRYYENAKPSGSVAMLGYARLLKYDLSR